MKFRVCTENSLAKKSLAIALLHYYYHYCNKKKANIARAIPTLVAKGVTEFRILAEPSMLGVLITAALFPTSSNAVFYSTNAG